MPGDPKESFLTVGSASGATMKERPVWPGCEHIDLNARVSLLPDAMRDVRGHIRSMLLSLRMKCVE